MTAEPSAPAAPLDNSAAEQRRGFLLGVAAYGMWGLLPLYWALLDRAGSLEILAHRVLWSAVVMVILTMLLRRGRYLRAIVADRRVMLLLTVAAAVISVNWLIYIWAVNHDRVVEGSLGYFINPLVTVLMGILILRERLRPWQWVAMGVAGTAVLALTLDYGEPPWVALALACSFGTYGVAKRLAGVGAVESLAFETLLTGPFAAAYVVWLVSTGDSAFGTEGTDLTLLLISTGLVTAIPLICFGGAATRIPMVTLGLLQYLAPIIQFALGVLWFEEDMPLGRWVGFVLVWTALMIFTFEAIRHRRAQLRYAAEASCAA